jgi:hypothetical protein
MDSEKLVKLAQAMNDLGYDIDKFQSSQFSVNIVDITMTERKTDKEAGKPKEGHDGATDSP